MFCREGESFLSQEHQCPLFPSPYDRTGVTLTWSSHDNQYLPSDLPSKDKVGTSGTTTDSISRRKKITEKFRLLTCLWQKRISCRLGNLFKRSTQGPSGTGYVVEVLRCHVIIISTPRWCRRSAAKSSLTLYRILISHAYRVKYFHVIGGYWSNTMMAWLSIQYWGIHWAPSDCKSQPWWNVPHLAPVCR